MKILLALLLTATVLSGATIDFCGGKVLCAELSTTAPAGVKSLKNEDAIYSDLPAQAVYGVLTVLFDKGRTVNLLDYALTPIGPLFHCVAILKEGKLIRLASGTSGTWKETEVTAPNARYTLVFMLDAASVGHSKEKTETLHIRPLFRTGIESEDAIPFTNLGSGQPTQAKNIPLSGKMTVKK